MWWPTLHYWKYDFCVLTVYWSFVRNFFFSSLVLHSNFNICLQHWNFFLLRPRNNQHFSSESNEVLQYESWHCTGWITMVWTFSKWTTIRLKMKLVRKGGWQSWKRAVCFLFFFCFIMQSLVNLESGQSVFVVWSNKWKKGPSWRSMIFNTMDKKNPQSGWLWTIHYRMMMDIN